MTFHEETLRKTYEYGGFRFWENYILSNIIRNLAEDIKVLGTKSVVDGYVCLFGEAAEDLIEYLVTQDITLLQEASKITDGLLFEDYLEPNINRHMLMLLEYEQYDLPGMVTTNKGTTTRVLRNPTQAMPPAIQARGGALRTLLVGAWNKLKALGKTIFAPLIPNLQQGFAWAKALARKGLAWFNATPWAQMLLPILLITGSVRVAKRLLNRTRRKKLTRQEAAALQEYAMKNNSKINALRKKAGLQPITV